MTEQRVFKKKEFDCRDYNCFLDDGKTITIVGGCIDSPVCDWKKDMSDLRFLCEGGSEDYCSGFYREVEG